ncbi:hypothetical protein KTI96_01370 [Acinetobacter bereziniae]|uniref:hypothetical protein n=1 Tax=Acinetobacter bereziniae TaxID=106648 RepID=UPI0021CDBBBB|nr:hypothetical protein [Acinetobacter bereziniae]MCU4535812.1 hypothetical protein [Acinetobacter bereziniae]
MKIIEGQIENLFVHKAKYDFIKNSGKQATVSAALGAAVGSAALASQAVLVANSQWDVKECSFELNGQKYEGLFEDIYFSNHAQLICLVQDHIALVLIDPKDNKMYIPIGTGETIKQLKRKHTILYAFYILIMLVLLVILKESILFSLTIILLYSLIMYFFMSLPMYRAEKGKGLLTEKIIELLGVTDVNEINLTKNAFVDKNQTMTKSWVIEYQNAFKENNPYPKDYFEKNENN